MNVHAIARAVIPCIVPRLQLVPTSIQFEYINIQYNIIKTAS